MTMYLSNAIPVLALLLIVVIYFLVLCDARVRMPQASPPQQTVTSASVPPSPENNKTGGGVGSVTFTFKSSSVSCAICLEDYKSGEECRLFLKCNHGYHKACIDLWLTREEHCPLCRGSVGGESVRAPDRSLDQVV